MNFHDLKKDAINVAYQLRKNFPENESPVGHYICQNHVVVLSTLKLYVFYCDVFTDYKQGKLQDVILRNTDIVNNKCSVTLENRDFDFQFLESEEFENFLKYIKKYKN